MELPGQISTEIDNCFIRSKDLDAIAAVDGLAARYLRFSRRQAPGNVDAYHVGPSPWSLVYDRLVNTAHTAPWSLEDAPEGDLIPPTYEFILTEEAVRQRTADFFKAPEMIRSALRSRIASRRERFAYIETELRDRIGHRFSLAFSLSEVAQAGGLEPIIGANLALTRSGTADGICVDPCFSSYSQAPEELVTPTQFARELAAFIREHRLCASDYVYLHMPYPTLIVGILQVVATSRIEDLPIFLIRICSDDESFRWHDIRQTSCLRAVGELGAERRDRIRIFVESLPLQRYFQERTGQTFPVLLNPVGRELAFVNKITAARARQRKEDDALVIGYLGEARQEKGFHLLPDIVGRLLRRYGARVRFMLQTSSAPSNDSEAVRQARAELEDLAARHFPSGAISLCGNSDDLFSYYERLAQCDILLLPYDPWAYRNRGSGVAVEALSLGLPIIVAATSDMATTFAGPGCIVAPKFSAEGFEEACCSALEDYPRISRGLRDRAHNSPLIHTGEEYLHTLLNSGPQYPTDNDPPKQIAIWIGNEVIRQGCSAVYEAQRAFLRRQGFEVYNVYVPFPAADGSLLSDSALEKHLLGNALGWYHDGYDFGCYSWMLNQADDAQRSSILEEITDSGGSTGRLIALNEYNVFPDGLISLIENRSIDLVCVNYVHLLPIVEALGLLTRTNIRVVLESHDIQAHQYSARYGRGIDIEDREVEMAQLSKADAVVAISLAESATMRELNPWADIHFVLPTIRSGGCDWDPGAAFMTAEWLDVWAGRDDLKTEYDLRTPDSITRFLGWILIVGRREFPTCSIHPSISRAALLPHIAFPPDDDGASVPNVIGLMWQMSPDLHAKWPSATIAGHPDRVGLLRWALDGGLSQAGIDGLVPPLSQDEPTCPCSHLEAIVLAHPTRVFDNNYRKYLIEWLVRHPSPDLIIVGSDHPANIKSIKWFIDEVFGPYLQPKGISLLLVGRAGDALPPNYAATDHLFPVGEVASLDTLYKLAKIVAVPTVVGAGTPIKALDALARGLCISAHKFVDEAVGLSTVGFPLADSPNEFALDILNLLSSQGARQLRIGLAKKFNETQLTTSVYDAKWRQLAGISSRGGGVGAVI